MGAHCTSDVNCESGCCVNNICLNETICSEAKLVGQDCFYKSECQSGCCFADKCVDSRICGGSAPGNTCQTSEDCQLFYCCGPDNTCVTQNECQDPIGTPCVDNSTCCCVDDVCALARFCVKEPIGAACIGRSFCESDCCSQLNTC